jgi:hypothetical protein
MARDLQIGKWGPDSAAIAGSQRALLKRFFHGLDGVRKAGGLAPQIAIHESIGIRRNGDFLFTDCLAASEQISSAIATNRMRVCHEKSTILGRGETHSR